MNIIQTLLAFLFALCVLIIFHELGHYWIARLCNVKVIRFSLGFGKVLVSRRFGKDQTEWAISAIPFGGYVQMLDMREQDMSKVAPNDLEREFTRQSVGKRIAIVVAGPMANFLLAIVFFVVIFMVGMPEPIAKLRQPDPTSIAYQAGLRGNEVVKAVNGKSIKLWSDLRWELMQNALEKQSANLTVESASSQIYSITLPLAQLSPEDLESDFLNKLGLKLALSKAQLGQFKSDSPALRAGLREGDVVLQIDGKKILDSLELIDVVQAAPNKVLHFSVDRAGNTLDFPVMPDAVLVNGATMGKLKVEVRSIPEMFNHRDTLLPALQKSLLRTWDISALTLKMLGKMIIGEVSLKNITGPITIADYAGQTARIGWMSYLSFLALISISLGVMNLLPIPMLDGGHLMYYSVEILTGRPVSARVGEIAQRVGLTILLLIMAVAVFNDVTRLFS